MTSPRSIASNSVMKTFTLQLAIAAALLAPFNLVPAQQPDSSEQAVGEVIEHYFDAVTNRDAPALRKVLGKKFVVMHAITEAGNKNAHVEFVDTADDSKLLPPEGNDDMHGLQVTSMEVQFSDSNSTAAIASFVVSRSLTKSEMVHFQTLLQHLKATSENRTEPDVDQVRIERMLADEQMRYSMLAMLGRQAGEWKIVCMSFPG